MAGLAPRLGTAELARKRMGRLPEGIRHSVAKRRCGLGNGSGTRAPEGSRYQGFQAAAAPFPRQVSCRPAGEHLEWAASAGA